MQGALILHILAHDLRCIIEYIGIVFYAVVLLSLMMMV
jgi:hypothetical protein